jgi:hypothetical protein
MNMTHRFIAFLMLSALAPIMATAADESPVSAVFASMRSRNYAKEYGRYTFPDLSTNDIPELLEHAAVTNVLRSFPVNQVSSFGRLSCAEGMIALWLIEGIRVGKKFPSLVPACYDRRKAVQADSLSYAEADQDAVATAYLSWWQNTKGQTNDLGPLAGTSLTWFRGRTPEEWKK